MKTFLTCMLLLPIWLQSLQSSFPASDNAVVHAVLFYSPSCGHCELVITETLPPLFEQYGEQLSIVGVDVTQPAGQVLFQAALQYFNQESGPVPFLVVGDTYCMAHLISPRNFLA